MHWVVHLLVAKVVMCIINAEIRGQTYVSFEVFCASAQYRHVFFSITS